MTEDPISPEKRLGVYLYRLARGDYHYTIAEMAEIGVATVSTVVDEVCEAIVKNMWAISVDRHFPEGELQLKEKMLDMDKIWQFARLLVGCRWLSYPNEMSCGGGGGGGQAKNTTISRTFIQ